MFITSASAVAVAAAAAAAAAAVLAGHKAGMHVICLRCGRSPGCRHILHSLEPTRALKVANGENKDS
jgi:hypothetical protein